jgi:steroid delta-isomerase-like uncharacterized protein
MSIAQNKALVERYLELYRSGNLSIADEIVAADFVDHAHPESPRGAAGVKEMVQQARQAFPGLAISVQQLIAEEDFVVFHFALTGIHAGPLGDLPPSGKRVTIRGIDLFRIAEGKLIELWSYQDTLAFLRQIGLTLTAGADT